MSESFDFRVRSKCYFGLHCSDLLLNGLCDQYFNWFYYPLRNSLLMVYKTVFAMVSTCIDIVLSSDTLMSTLMYISHHNIHT